MMGLLFIEILSQKILWSIMRMGNLFINWLILELGKKWKKKEILCSRLLPQELLFMPLLKLINWLQKIRF
jgi:hypothetical protein